MIRHTTAVLTIALTLCTFVMAEDNNGDVLQKLVPADAKVEKLAGGMQFIEGPVWTDADGGYLVFSDIPANELKRWDAKSGLTVFKTDTQGTNGNTRDPQGRIVSCRHTARNVVRIESDGSLAVLADSYANKKFNSPNDVVVKSDGTVWFTDPTYGLPKGEKAEQSGREVYCVDPKRQHNNRATLQPVTDRLKGFDQPNGLCFSPDESKLYVADSGKPHHIRVFDVDVAHADRITTIPWSLNGGDVFCVIDKGAPDGIRCDEHGNVWSGAGDGVHVFAPDGRRIGKIAVPETPANLCFGGKDGKTLFITARSSLYSIHTLVRGTAKG